MCRFRLQINYRYRYTVKRGFGAKFLYPDAIPDAKQQESLVAFMTGWSSVTRSINNRECFLCVLSILLWQCQFNKVDRMPISKPYARQIIIVFCLRS